ncbi:MAG TPA: hypothetical protein VK658_20810 [Chryseolinea sp.]|nr:hypothetical protein [Chryseolinea sp.]
MIKVRDLIPLQNLSIVRMLHKAFDKRWKLPDIEEVKQQAEQ